MSARYPFDPFAVPNGPDIEYPAARQRRSVAQVLLRALLAIGGFIAASFVLSSVLFVPILIGEIIAIDAVVVGGHQTEVADFVSKLGALFLGTLVVAVAVLSIIASAALAAGKEGRWEHPVSDEVRREQEAARYEQLKLEAGHVRAL
ncbi:hypothetical protein [Roseibium polysiphoniae]|uniref:hypothetical protein n=1 Tax=Roseibium polysiphoniae TaxID=2571221 RepID=UPI00329969C6